MLLTGASLFKWPPKCGTIMLFSVHKKAVIYFMEKKNTYYNMHMFVQDLSSSDLGPELDTNDQ